MSKNNAAGVSGEQAAPSTGNDANPEPPPINPDLRESEIARNTVILHVSTHPERAQELAEKVRTYAPDMQLVIVDSPLRAFVRPLLAYVDAVHSQHPTAFVTIVLPEFITAHWRDGFLHNRSAALLRNALERHPNVAVVLVPYLLEH